MGRFNGIMRSIQERMANPGQDDLVRTGVCPHLVVMTGAGISAESGIPTYRGAGGLWQGHDARRLATPAAFAADPGLVARFYDMRRKGVAEAQPNMAHLALAGLARSWAGRMDLITTNVDDLHERAGSEGVHHLHGRIGWAQCPACHAHWPEQGLLLTLSCPYCRRAEPMRPDVVFFGEMPRQVDTAFAATDTCDIFVAIGCGGAVSPANLLPRMARNNNRRAARMGMEECTVVEINPEPTGDPAYNQVITGSATQEVEAWIATL